MVEKSHAEKKGLTVRDLVITGTFSALLWLAMMLGGIPLGINPVTTFYMPLSCALFGGPIFLLLVAKVPKRGPIIIAGVLIGIIYFFTGMHWGHYLGYIICGILADFVAGIKKYKSAIMNSFSYAVLCLGCTGSYIIYFINPASWISTMLEKGTQHDYIDTMNAVANNISLIIIFIGTIIIALLSAYAGMILLKKQFEKSGVTA
jgi:energy-coupling factor transport system substrate-specific component